VSAGVTSLPCPVNAVGGGEHRLGLSAEKRAPALPALSADLSEHVQGTALALATESLAVTPTCAYRSLYGRIILACKSLLFIQFSERNMCIGPQFISCLLIFWLLKFKNPISFSQCNRKILLAFWVLAEGT